MSRNGTNKDKKKIEGTDRYENRNCRRGRQAHQSLKAYWILQYLINNATEEIPVSINELIYELEDKGINTDRKSIYRDIKEINIINYLLENEDADVFDAEDAYDEDIEGLDRLVVYDKINKGYYVSRRNYDETDIQLIVECIYSSRFLTEKQTNRLVDIACRVISEGEANKFKHPVHSFDREKTDNKNVLNSINKINEAMSSSYNGEKKQPCKIKFNKLTVAIRGEKLTKVKYEYKVSPFNLVIYNSDYYLICFNSRWHKNKGLNNDEELGVFEAIRVDEIADIECLYDEKREGEYKYTFLDIAELLRDDNYSYREDMYLTEKIFRGEKAQKPKKEKVILRLGVGQLPRVLKKYGSEKARYEEVDYRTCRYENEIYVDYDFYEFLDESFPRMYWENPNEEYKKYLKKRFIRAYDSCIAYEKGFEAVPNVHKNYPTAVLLDWEEYFNKRKTLRKKRGSEG